MKAYTILIILISHKETLTSDGGDDGIDDGVDVGIIDGSKLGFLDGIELEA